MLSTTVRLNTLWLATFMVVGLVASSVSPQEVSQGLHRSLDGVIVDKGGTPAVKVPDGTVYQLDQNRALRHGHALPPVGDEVTVVIDENNMVLEMHPKGTEGTHRFVTGDIVSVGLRERTITLKTKEGDKSFPLEKQEMSASIRDGVTVTAELNEAGHVIALQPHERLNLRPDEKRTPINRSH